MKQSKNKIIHAAWTTVFLFTFSIAQAQNNLNITFRPGASFPVKELGETKLSNGGGFEATLAYKFLPHLQAYAGWGWNSFSEIESVATSNLQFEETGYSFGLQFIHPMSPTSKLNFMVGGGGIYNHIETENDDGDIIYDTGHGLGWQAEAGLLISIGHHDRWYIMPTARYHALSREGTSDTTTLDLNYFSIGVGVTWILWKADSL